MFLYGITNTSAALKYSFRIFIWNELELPNNAIPNVATIDGLQDLVSSIFRTPALARRR